MLHFGNVLFDSEMKDYSSFIFMEGLDTVSEESTLAESEKTFFGFAKFKLFSGRLNALGMNLGHTKNPLY